MATLHTVLEFLALRDTALNTWDTFVRALNVDNVPLLLVTEVIEYPVSRDDGFLQRHFKDITPIPDYPELRNFEQANMAHRRSRTTFASSLYVHHAKILFYVSMPWQR
jgi:hypothetical protein